MTGKQPGGGGAHGPSFGWEADYNYIIGGEKKIRLHKESRAPVIHKSYFATG